MPNGKKAAPPAQEAVVAPKELTPKQKLFVEHYLVTRNATKAAREAGYTGSDKAVQVSGSRLLSNPIVKAAVEKGFDEIKERVKFSHEDVLGWLEQIRLRCMEAEPVLDRQGHRTGEYKFDANGALRASELMGRHFGMWKKEQDDGSGKGKGARGSHFDTVRAALSRVKR